MYSGAIQNDTAQRVKMRDALSAGGMVLASDPLFKQLFRPPSNSAGGAYQSFGQVFYNKSFGVDMYQGVTRSGFINPYMLMSTDGGLTWTDYQNWTNAVQIPLIYMTNGSQLIRIPGSGTSGSTVNSGNLVDAALTLPASVNSTTTTGVWNQTRTEYLLTIGVGVWHGDGSTWTANANAPTSFNKMVCDGVIYVASTSTGSIYSSTDGSAWTLKASGLGTIADLVYGGGVYIARTTTVIYASTNLTNWSRFDPSATMYSLIYGGGKFYCNTSLSTLLISADGVNWTSRKSGVDESGSTHGILGYGPNGLMYFFGAQAYYPLANTKELVYE